MEKGNNTIRVLLDCSMATLQYGGGIPLDTRLLFRTFSAMREVELWGLIYVLGGNVMLHRFKKSKTDRGSRVFNQSLFLHSLLSPHIPWPKWKLARLWQIMVFYYRLLLERNVKTDVLDNQALWHVIWRNLFSVTLAPEDIPIIQKGRFVLARLSNNTMLSRVFMKLPQPKLNTKGFDFAIFQDSRPVRVSDGTVKIVRYHDALPITSADVITREHTLGHYLGIKGCIKDSFYVCNSEPTREDLVNLFPLLGDRSFTIPYALSPYYYPDKNTDLFCDILRLRLSRAPVDEKAFKDVVKNVDRLVEKVKRSEDISFILHVATLEPRKNLPRLIEAFQMLKARVKSDIRLIIVGNLGWKYEPILAQMRPFAERGELIHLESVPHNELRVLYSQATVFVFPSLEEGFGLPPMEAILCGTPVAVSDIRHHRWVMGDAAVYFNPYSIESIAEALRKVLEASHEERKEMTDKGFDRARLYSAERVSGMWRDLFVKLKERAKGKR